MHSARAGFEYLYFQALLAKFVQLVEPGKTGTYNYGVKLFDCFTLIIHVFPPWN
jgi:hypothetical protein